MTEWQGTTPYVLTIVPDDMQPIQIDLDERGWATTYADYMRAPGMWALEHKDGRTQTLVLVVHPGEQPYYTARHIGIAGSGGSNEVVAYGIGKKLVDGSVMRVWQMPDGRIVGGDDVDSYGIHLVKAIGPRTG